MNVDTAIPKNMSETQRLQNLSEDELSMELVAVGASALIFVEILRRYQKQIYYHCRNLLVNHDDADDAAQNTFIKVWQNLGQFKGESRLRTWVYRIATNESINLIRKRRPSYPWTISKYVTSHMTVT
jgi:RNA polymerase sigma-70 factor (ECF subfamily)